MTRRWPLLLLLLAACATPEPESVPVECGEFVIDIPTRGEMRAVEFREVSKPRKGGWSRSQIVRMAPEGSVVEEGDFLIQFDTAEAERDLVEKQNELQDARANLATERATAVSRMAELRSQLQNQEFSHEQARIQFEQMQYEAEIRRREQELELKKAELALQEAQEKIESQRIVDEANLRKANLAVTQAEAELTKQEEVVASMTVTAPIAGLVVYKEIWNQGGGRAKVKVGDSPWAGMPLIEIPDLDEMMVQTKVNEISINRVSKGQRVTIAVDALPDTTFTGEVTNIATLAKREGESDVKNFDVEVRIEGSDPRLRPGMTAQCRIETARLDEVCWIPLEAVFEDEGETVCYVVAGSIERRVVELGARNADFVVVESGLEPDERVSLRDPNRALEEIGGDPPETD